MNLIVASCMIKENVCAILRHALKCTHVDMKQCTKCMP